MKKVKTKDVLNGTRTIATGKPKSFRESAFKGKMFKFAESPPLIVSSHFTNDTVLLRDPHDPRAVVYTAALSIRAMIACGILVPCSNDGKELAIDRSPLESSPSEVVQGKSPLKSTIIRRGSKKAPATVEMEINFFDRRKAYVEAVIESNGNETTAEIKAIIARVFKQIGDKNMPTVKMVRDWLEAYRRNGCGFSILVKYHLSLN